MDGHGTSPPLLQCISRLGLECQCVAPATAEACAASLVLLFTHDYSQAGNLMQAYSVVVDSGYELPGR